MTERNEGIREERWVFSASVGLLLSNVNETWVTDRQLVMVRKRESGLWTLISGGIKQEEDLINLFLNNGSIRT